jgi:hypothetical protein
MVFTVDYSTMQEIYPPKVKEFAYVTDGACMVSDILDEELKIYKVISFLW